jgi:hypothetical protein
MSKTKGIFLACLVTENRASNIRVQLILGENARRTLRCKCNKKMYSFYTGRTGTVLLLLSMSRVLAAFSLFRAFMDRDLSLLCSGLSRFVSNEKEKSGEDF